MSDVTARILAMMSVSVSWNAGFRHDEARDERRPVLNAALICRRTPKHVRASYVDTCDVAVQEGAVPITQHLSEKMRFLCSLFCRRS